jgi:pyruvate dehydrogenase E2 component (dihydrolipoamide acetyltransferase)
VCFRPYFVRASAKSAKLKDMAEKFLMPKLSPTMEEGQISRWLKNEGDSYEANETLAEVDTDKATMEMTALNGGTLLKIIKQAGETAALGEPIAIVGQAGEDFSGLLAEINGAKAAPEAEAKPELPKDEDILDLLDEVLPTQAEPQSATLQTAQNVETQPETKVESREEPATTNGRLLVSPIAARMASENGIDLRALHGSGPNGRIIKRDIESAIALKAQAPKVKETVVETPKPAIVAPQIFGASPYHEENTTQMRRVIAQRLATSIGPIPTFFLTVEIEMDNALTVRKQINANLSDEEKISVNDIIVKVVAMSLLKHPFVNASYQDKTIRFYEDADIGVAVAIEDGLITPVIRSANKKGLAQISKEIKEMAGRAREKKLQPEEYTGATFSVSNLGMFGIKEFTAIINPPESGILAIGAATPTAVVRDGQVVVRNMMNVTMSCDHRVVDGATGAKFLQTFKQMLENPVVMLL